MLCFLILYQVFFSKVILFISFNYLILNNNTQHNEKYLPKKDFLLSPVIHTIFTDLKFSSPKTFMV